MPYNKVTYGFVVQAYNDDGTPIAQNFCAGDQVEYEDFDGNPVEVPEGETYLPFDMKQPEDMGE